MSPLDQRIMQALSASERVTTEEIARRVGITLNCARSRLTGLRADQLIISDRHGIKRAGVIEMADLLRKKWCFGVFATSDRGES